MLLNILLTIYVALMALDILFMISLHFFHDRKGYYKTAAGIWVGLFTAFGMDGLIASEFNMVHHLFGIGFANIMSYHLGKLASDIYRLSLPTSLLLKISLGLWALGFVMHFVLGLGFTPTAVAICSGIAATPVLAAIHILRLKAKLTIIDRLFAFLLLGEGVHMLDYPFLRNVESMPVFGFSLGLALVYFASMLIPVVINRRISADFSEVLERKVDEKTESLERSLKDLKHAQAQLITSSKLAALGEMAGGVAHEINNPLAVIHSRARHIQKVLAANPPKVDSANEFAKIIETTSDRIALIVRGLKTFSRSGENDPFERCDINDILIDTLSLCSERLRLHGIDLTFEGPTGPLEIQGRAVQISQVLLNLLNNAHDAVENLSEKWVRISLSDLGEKIRISVTDSGKGIPPDVRDKIMQPFFTTKPVGKGTGLGLSVSRGIVDEHQGTLTLDDNAPNTRFVLELPKKISDGSLGLTAA